MVNLSVRSFPTLLLFSSAVFIHASVAAAVKDVDAAAAKATSTTSPKKNAATTTAPAGKNAAATPSGSDKQPPVTNEVPAAQQVSTVSADPLTVVSTSTSSVLVTVPTLEPGMSTTPSATRVPTSSSSISSMAPLTSSSALAANAAPTGPSLTPFPSGANKISSTTVISTATNTTTSATTQSPESHNLTIILTTVLLVIIFALVVSLLLLTRCFRRWPQLSPLSLRTRHLSQDEKSRLFGGPGEPRRTPEEESLNATTPSTFRHWKSGLQRSPTPVWTQTKLSPSPTTPLASPKSVFGLKIGSLRGMSAPLRHPNLPERPPENSREVYRLSSTTHISSAPSTVSSTISSSTHRSSGSGLLTSKNPARNTFGSSFTGQWFDEGQVDDSLEANWSGGATRKVPDRTMTF